MSIKLISNEYIKVCGRKRTLKSILKDAIILNIILSNWKQATIMSEEEQLKLNNDIKNGTENFNLDGLHSILAERFGIDFADVFVCGRYANKEIENKYHDTVFYPISNFN